MNPFEVHHNIHVDFDSTISFDEEMSKKKKKKKKKPSYHEEEAEAVDLFGADDDYELERQSVTESSSKRSSSPRGYLNYVDNEL